VLADGVYLVDGRTRVQQGVGRRPQVRQREVTRRCGKQRAPAAGQHREHERPGGRACCPLADPAGAVEARLVGDGMGAFGDVDAVGRHGVVGDDHPTVEGLAEQVVEDGSYLAGGLAAAENEYFVVGVEVVDRVLDPELRARQGDGVPADTLGVGRLDPGDETVQREVVGGRPRQSLPVVDHQVTTHWTSR